MKVLGRRFAWSVEHLEGRFVLLSLLVLTAIGIVLYAVFSVALTRLALSDAVQETGSDNSALSPLFAGLPAGEPLSPAQLEAIDRAVEERGGGRYALVKVWTPGGRIYYATQRDLIDHQGDLSANPDLRTGLSGQMVGSLSDESDGEAQVTGATLRPMLEVYTPLRDAGGQVVGAFETYTDATPLAHQVQNLRRILAGGLGTGLLVMWAALFSLIHQAGAALRRDHRARIRLEQQLEETLRGALAALSEAVEAKDAYTSGHVDRVAAYAGAVARALDVAGEERREIEYAALLHDVGKMSIPDAILQKPGALTPEERQVMQSHSAKGEHILRRVPTLQQVSASVRHHHERWDGGGYPDGLAGEAIPLGARIIAVVDSYDAMTTDRPYRAGRSREEALVELHRMTGTQFDPRVVRAFMNLPAGDLEEIRIGSSEAEAYAQAAATASAPSMA